MRVHSATTIIAVVAISPSLVGQIPRAPELVAKARPAVVTLRTFDAAGQAVSSGSGFIVAGGRVVSNAHVVQGAARVEVTDHEDRLLGTVDYAENISSRSDLVVLPAMPRIPATLVIRAREPSVGEGILVIGTPRGLTSTVSTGIVSAYRDLEGQRLMQVTAPISQGSSGGPVLDAQGKVIGVSVAIIQDGQNLNFAVPAADVMAVIGSPPGRLPFPGADVVAERNIPVAARDYLATLKMRWPEAPAGKRIDGTIDTTSHGETDFVFHHFDGVTGETITVQASAVDLALGMSLYFVARDTIVEVAEASVVEGSLDLEISVQLPTTGTYAVGLSSRDGFTGKYAVRVSRGTNPGRFVYDQRWSLIGSHQEERHWLDITSMKPIKKDRVTASTITEYYDVQHFDGTRYNQSRLLQEYDCAKRRTRSLEEHLFLDAETVSESTTPGGWWSWIVGSVGEHNGLQVCAVVRR